MKTLLALFVTTLGLLLAGCNTLEGLGQDIQKGGQVLEDAAKKK
jgi:predicted small secreted protein